MVRLVANVNHVPTNDERMKDDWNEKEMGEDDPTPSGHVFSLFNAIFFCEKTTIQRRKKKKRIN